MIICSPCKEEFETNDEYLAHVCSSSNTTPTDPAYLGESFSMISEKALERGAAKAAAASEQAPAE